MSQRSGAVYHCRSEGYLPPECPPSRRQNLARPTLLRDPVHLHGTPGQGPTAPGEASQPIRIGFAVTSSFPSDRNGNIEDRSCKTGHVAAAAASGQEQVLPIRAGSQKGGKEWERRRRWTSIIYMSHETMFI